MLLAQRGLDYSIRVTELVKYLRSDGKDFPLCDELLRCGVETGIHLQASQGRSKAVTYLTRADYLMEMATVAGYLTPRQSERIRQDGKKLLEMILSQTEEGGDAR